jgi:hypothetical protein
MAKHKTKGRVYLSEEEKKILASLLEEWNGKPDKKSRDSFISAEALPKIQQLNLSTFGPEIISKDKEAKITWERRVQVRILHKSCCSFAYTFSRRYSHGLRTTSHTKTELSSSWNGKYHFGGL